MVRLRRPESQVGAHVSSSVRNSSEAQETQSSSARPTRRKPTSRHFILDDSEDEEPVPFKRTVSKPTANPRKTASQVRLAPLQSLSSLVDLTIQDDTPEKTRRRSPLKQDARRLLQKKPTMPHTGFENFSLSAGAEQTRIPKFAPADEADESEDEVEEETDVEESIWCGSAPEASAYEDDLPSPDFLFPTRRKKTLPKQHDLATQLEALSIFEKGSRDPSSKNVVPDKKTCSDSVRPVSSSDKENQEGIIRFSPPRSKRPIIRDSIDRPTTPPLPPPSPTKLKSPSKRPPRIPTPPGHPSLDEFWSAAAVNDWNDQYSPQKPIRSPRKLFEPQTKISDDAPITSPIKLQSPSKRTKAEIQARKDWDTRKVSLAEAFLHELDQTITQGQIAALSASAGGVQIVWSKTLNSTAGRANWRRETTKISSRSDPSKSTTTTHKHFASIELAEKVLTYSPDGETKLLNVLAHEFCHLANFMISGVKDQPHGASFKAWGRQCSKAFASKGIEVTTKHSYEIEYKYVWRCVAEEECGMEFKRHSKSIDPNRHRCGACKASLVQVKPVPRGGGGVVAKTGTSTPTEGAAPGKTGQVNGYAAYVKQHFATLKKSMPGSSHKEVMEALGRQYRAEKASKTESKAADDVVEKLAAVQLDGKEVIVID